MKKKKEKSLLTPKAKAKAINLAMRLEILGYDSPLFQKFINKFSECKNEKFKQELLEFLKNTSTMTQRLYLELIRENNFRTENSVSCLVSFIEVVYKIAGIAIIAGIIIIGYLAFVESIGGSF